uniref:Cytosolic beta-glucosidase n=1 Tax=Geotrypetes seraphini TaxID=260995 RepID=A0A6P8RK02_GEOSA|nr:lactase-like protein [Geotrypetes seraphini]XP_033804394.1 lactase-like protein [Geotrypetes seraphini]XP_033804402.1 lactase-like protein [Geotrypetes seraphini]XP_033804411.1 lactase-like protein [Geotrypetes seraphini]XP_033804421.1 lactase-like protein [Geotrypetes seraphini]XP_033804431.1 lactase-like protein [Geotrypetes seraphini]
MTSDLELYSYTFPNGFAWGTSTAAYQIEGGWVADGKGPNVWDTFTHQGGDRVFKNQTGDVACGSYTLWEEDLKCIKQLGLTHYRFSLSWSRLLPDGTTGFINQKGIDYYNKVIDDLLTKGITPMVTLYHFDMPQALEDQDGWRSEKIVGIFNEYAEFCFNTFGNRVKLWITINEPFVVAKFGYENGLHAPGIKEPGTGAYQTAHNMIKAHAKTWHTYHLLFKEKQHGSVSIALNADWSEPLDPTSVIDEKATERRLAFSLDWFAKPIFIDGDYPPLMKLCVAAKSKEQGYPSSRLPEFTKEEMQMIKGTADFFCLNYYTTRKIRHQEYAQAGPSFKADEEVEEIKDPSWPICGIEWLAVVPWGIRKLLKYVKDIYNDPIIYITENGFAQSDPASLEDTLRWEYFRQILLEILKGIYLDKVNVKGYFVWSLLDCFEWTEGYNKRFGLFHVDFNSSSLLRTAYTSASEYAKVVASNRLPAPENKLE